VLIDATETSPTFSTNPIRREKEVSKKRAEFRAYLLGKKENSEAWRALLGREICPSDVKETGEFLLASEAGGMHSYEERPVGKGNCLIGVAKLKESFSVSADLLSTLDMAKLQKGTTGLILLSRTKWAEEMRQELKGKVDAFFLLENVPHDPIGFIETILLKQVLHLISNGSMVLMNKVHGNQMIDVRASNKKLIDRCLRLIKGIWGEYRSELLLSDKELYHYIAHVSAYKKEYEEKGIYTPSVVKIVLAMLSLQKTPSDFQEVVDFLREKQENMDWLR